VRPVLLPRSLDELWEALEEHPQAALYAGGTDLLVRLRQGLVEAPALVCLERLSELAAIEDRGQEVLIGALATHQAVLDSELVRREFPVLTAALAELGSPPIRHMGTLGGNIVTASPAGDSLPPLYVLEAEVELRSFRGRRRLPLAEFITGPGCTRLERGEVLAGVWVPKAAGFNRHHFEKVGRRKALAISVASLAALLEVSDEGVVQRARLAWGSVGPTVIRSREVEELLEGRPLDEATLRRAAEAARRVVQPISDLRASADYRRRVAGNLLLRLVVGG
jgi:xanthine dehydrogenase FAD-binding subunit